MAYRRSATTPAIVVRESRVGEEPLVAGRWLTDREPSPVVMINESFAHTVFGRANPLGRRLSAPGGARARSSPENSGGAWRISPNAWRAPGEEMRRAQLIPFGRVRNGYSLPEPGTARRIPLSYS